MSYNEEKNKFTAELLEVVEINVDKCKFTQDEYLTYGAITVNSAIASSGTGSILAISGGEASRFTASSYLLIDDELIQVTVNSDSQLTVTGRAQYGTVAAAHSSGTSAQLKHSGEVDGSCYNTPQTCSDPNSFEDGVYTALLFPSTTLTNGEQGLNGLDSVTFADTVADIGRSIGKRGKATITIRDSIDDKASYDKKTLSYPDRWSTKGTRLGKQLARS